MAAELRKPSPSETADSIVLFPMSGQHAFVKRCAAELDNLHGENANVYWRKQCRELAGRLQSYGCSEDDIREQVCAFQDAVQMELCHRHQQNLDAGTH